VKICKFVGLPRSLCLFFVFFFFGVVNSIDLTFFRPVCLLLRLTVCQSAVSQLLGLFSVFWSVDQSTGSPTV